MTKFRPILLASAWLLSLGLAFWFGHLWPRRDNSAAQVECLKKMWGLPFTLEVHERVRRLEHDPEAVRSYLLDVLVREGWRTETGAMTITKKLKPGEGVTSLDELSSERPRAANLLALWEPGQTDIRKTRKPAHQVDKSPLWDLYLTNPDEAWRRGVDEFGVGGR